MLFIAHVFNFLENTWLEIEFHDHTFIRIWQNKDQKNKRKEGVVSKRDTGLGTRQKKVRCQHWSPENNPDNAQQTV